MIHEDIRSTRKQGEEVIEQKRAEEPSRDGVKHEIAGGDQTCPEKGIESIIDTTKICKTARNHNPRLRILHP